MHTTISVVEGILEYAKNGYRYRLKELQEAEDKSRTFLLQHRLFRSDRTGNIIDKKMLMLSYPSRWRYDILRAMDYLRLAGVEYDARMDDAIDVLLKKREPTASGRFKHGTLDKHILSWKKQENQVVVIL